MSEKGRISVSPPALLPTAPLLRSLLWTAGCQLHAPLRQLRAIQGEKTSTRGSPGVEQAARCVDNERLAAAAVGDLICNQQKRRREQRADDAADVKA